MTPFDAQTGPARRNDKNTIDKQLTHLTNTQYQSLYSAFTESILTTYGHQKL